MVIASRQNVHFTISAPTKALAKVVKKTKEQTYRKAYNNAVLLERALEWYKSSDTLRSFCLCNPVIPKATFTRHMTKSTLRKMRDDKAPVAAAVIVFEKYLTKLSGNTSSRPNVAHDSNRYLTDNEELHVVQLIRLLAGMGFGITLQEAREIIDEIVSFNEPGMSHVECSDKVLRRIFKIYPDLQAKMAASLDPLRALKATTEVRDAMFTKLDAYIKNLKADNLISWGSYDDIPNDCIYNMDEVGCDTTKHRNKTICSTLNSMERPFQRTPEGDNKMNMHVTCSLTTRADGECYLRSFLFFLLPITIMVDCRVKIVA
jgi:hypothetical protein